MSGLKCTTCGYANPPGTPRCKQCNAPLSEGAGPSGDDRLALRPGQVLAKRYQVLGQIGRGGMGAIYRVHDRVLNEQVALKTLLPQFAQDKTIVDRFYNEARIARQLSHPFIVRVHDIGMAGPLMYISMEYLQGKSLRGIMESQPVGKCMPLNQLVSIFDQLCQALEYAHRYTIHRDIKPENVMVLPDGTVKLMDFGISKLMAHTKLTMTSMVMGTPQYMSPEQFRDSGNVDARADIYSLGVMLYEILTGDCPTGMAKPVSQVSRGVPSALDPIIAKCLAANPDERYQTVDEFRQALRQIAVLVEKPEAAAGLPGMRTQTPVWGLAVRVLGILLIVFIGAAAGLGAWGLANAPAPEDNEAVAPPPAQGEDDVRLALLARAVAAARGAAEAVLSEDDPRQSIVDTGKEYWSAATSAPAGEAKACAAAALQCFAAVADWTLLNPPSQTVFVTPAQVTIADDTGSQTVWVDGFFAETNLVSLGEFRQFAAEVPGGWPVPPVSQENPALDEQPVTNVPYYAAQAYAAWAQGQRVPDEWQWARLAEQVIGQEGFEAALSAEAPDEWTSSVYAILPYGDTMERSDPEAVRFAEESLMVVWDKTILPQDETVRFVRRSVPFQNASPMIGFRCIQPLPPSEVLLVKYLR